MVNMQNDNSSASTQILMALVPYSKQNLQLTFHPSSFFDELEKKSGFSRQTLQQSYARMKKRGLISNGKVPKLTVKGKQQVQPFVAKRLAGNGQLMVIFDIPEDFGENRRQLRTLLKNLGFTQVQRSVWMSSYDHADVIKETVEDLRIAGWVEIYEAAKIA